MPGRRDFKRKSGFRDSQLIIIAAEGEETEKRRIRRKLPFLPPANRGWFKKKIVLVHLQISRSLRLVFLLPGQESRRRSQKGPGEVFLVPSSLPPQRDAVAKKSLGGNGGSPHREKRNHRLFCEANAFLPGQGTNYL